MNSIQTRIDATSDRVRLSLPAMLKRIAWTYMPPLFVVMIINLIGTQVLVKVLPESTASILVLGANIIILVQGWRYLEQKYGGTKLYVLWVMFSHARRELRALLKQEQPDNTALDDSAAQMEQAADVFIQAVAAP